MAFVTPLRWAVFVSIALFALRLQLAGHVGFGDAEALYICYGLHPQPAYLDHPGFVGQVARWLGAPSPLKTHLLTAVLATAVPWLGGLAARATGAPWSRAARTVLALALAPEMAVGLFGLTPDLLMATAWLGALTLALFALSRPPSSFAAFAATLGVGALVGIATLSKVSALLLALALAASLGFRALRPRLRTFAPWAAALLVLLLLAPVVLWEVQNGSPMLRHRLITTQSQAGLSFRNLGALLGGQLVYVSPVLLVASGFVAVDLYRRRAEDAASRLLWLCTVVPGVVLAALCLWSKVAEPHWLAPAYLPLAIHAARSERVGPKLAVASLVTGAALTLLTWLWVATELPPRLLGGLYQPKYDLANDLVAWGPGGRLLDDAVTRTALETHRLPVVVGPHWVVCAQAQAALGNRAPVGCNTPQRDDFDRWYPRSRWLDAPVVLLVYDSRFPLDPKLELPGRTVKSRSKVEVRRGGRVVRTIWVTRLDKTEGVGQLGADTWGRSPAVRTRSSSAEGSGFGVVSNVSP